MKKTNLKSIFYPDYIAGSVLEIDVDELQRTGITHLVFDIDETVVPKNHNELTAEYIDLLAKAFLDQPGLDMATLAHPIAVEDIEKGEIFTTKNLRIIRPGDGLHPRYYESLLAKRASCDIKKGTPITSDFAQSDE